MIEYDTVYRQVIKQLYGKQTRPYSETEEKICEFSWAIVTRKSFVGMGVIEKIEYDVIENKSFICATNQIQQRTDFIEFEVDIYKLSNSYYLLQQADRLTYQLCNAKLYDFIR